MFSTSDRLEFHLNLRGPLHQLTEHYDIVMYSFSDICYVGHSLSGPVTGAVGAVLLVASVLRRWCRTFWCSVVGATGAALCVLYCWCCAIEMM